MFTGLVEEIGVVKRIALVGGAKRLTIQAKNILSDLKVDDSIAVNGVCLTVIAVNGKQFQVEAVQETLVKTTLSTIAEAARVNLERSLRFSDRLGGHLVQGHADGVGRVRRVETQEGGTLLQVTIPAELVRYVIPHGSIAMDGVSLTVARLSGRDVTVSLIPHTLSKTNLNALQTGDGVNIEVDLIGKYVEKLFTQPGTKMITEDWLLRAGYEG